MSSNNRLTELLLPTFKQNLKALLTWLDKCDDGNDEMLAKCLAPDMYPLATQVRFVCLQAQEAAYRLQAKEIPQELLDLDQEGRGFAEDCCEADTLVNAQARIHQAISVLSVLEPDAFDQDGSSERKLTIALPNEMKFDLTGEQYARDWALPQFYFHLVSAYAILRNSGVELGKADYVPHMFAYLQAPPAAVDETTTGKDP